jgi:hypothetical protein
LILRVGNNPRKLLNLLAHPTRFECVTIAFRGQRSRMDHLRAENTAGRRSKQRKQNRFYGAPTLAASAGAAGVHSDLLSFDLAAVMRKLNIFQFDEIGRVPPLMSPEQIDVVNWLLLDDASSGAEKR